MDCSHGDPPNPALSRSGEETPPPLVLAIPDVGEDSILIGFSIAVQSLRATLTQKMRVFKKAADQAQREGDQLRQSLLHGQILALRETVFSLDEEIMERFNLWGDQPADPFA